MECQHFGSCGSCREYEGGYTAQLSHKLAVTQNEFADIYSGDISLHPSRDAHYRARAEFRIWHEGNESFYAMHALEPKKTVMIAECPMVRESIMALMPRLLEAIKNEGIDKKLFGIDFLSSSSGEIVATLIYHRRLEMQWREKAEAISRELGIHIIGRSRGQKEVLTQDYVTETLHVKAGDFHFRHTENSFTQPNPGVNEAMITWVMSLFEGIGGDLLELYCGAGNFTIPFATQFEKVLATEISKSSIAAARVNMELNGVENIDFVRLGVEEFVQALDGVRTFNRMADIDLGRYHLGTIFVDPPRAGMDALTCSFVSRFEHVLYISCNPETLRRDLEMLQKTHEITDMALFDQFPYTHHREMGVKLLKKGVS